MADYHRYDREERAELGITPLNPDCNYLDIMAQHLGAPAPRRADPQAGLPATPTARSPAPSTSSPSPSSLIEGLLGYHSPELSLAVRRPRVPRAAGGAAARLEAQARHAPSAVHRRAGARGARRARAGLRGVHPAAEAARRPRRLVPARRRPTTPTTSTRCSRCATACRIPISRSLLDEDGRDGDHARAARAERCLYDPRSRRARARRGDRGGDLAEDALRSHLRTERLGRLHGRRREAHRSESLAIVQVLILYHLVTAKATVALGGDDAARRRRRAGVARRRSGCECIARGAGGDGVRAGSARAWGGGGGRGSGSRVTVLSNGKKNHSLIGSLGRCPCV